MYKVISSVIEHTRRHPVARHILRDVHANGHFNSPSSRRNSAESSETAKTAKNAEKWRYWSMRHDAFFLAARAADLSSLRAYPLSPSPSSLSSTTSSTRYPPPSGVSLARVQADGSSILRSHCYSKYPAPFGRARAREQERKRKREREHGAVCYNARPLLALLPVLLLLSLLLPVAAEWRMGKQRADEPAATSSAALEANYTPPARLASS